MDINKINELLKVYKRKNIKSNTIKFKSDNNIKGNNSFIDILSKVKKNKKTTKYKKFLEKLENIKDKILESNDNSMENKLYKLNSKLNNANNFKYNINSYNRKKETKTKGYYNYYYAQMQGKINQQNHVINKMHSKLNKLKLKNKRKIIKKQVDNNLNKSNNKINNNFVIDPLFLNLVLKSEKIPQYFKDFIIKNNHISQNELIQIINHFIFSDSEKNDQLKHIEKSKIQENLPPISNNKIDNLKSMQIPFPKIPIINICKKKLLFDNNIIFKKLKKFVLIEKICLKKNKINKPISNKKITNKQSNMDNKEEEILESDKNDSIDEISNESSINEEKSLKIVKKSPKKLNNKKKYKIILLKIWFINNINKLLWQVSNENYFNTWEYYNTDLLPIIDNFINDFNNQFIWYLEFIKDFKFEMNKKNNEENLIKCVEKLLKLINNYFNNFNNNINTLEFIKLLCNAFMNGSYTPLNYLNKFEINKIIFSYTGYISYKNKNIINKMLIEGLIIVRIIIYTYLFNNKQLIKDVVIKNKISKNLKIVGIFLYHSYYNKYLSISEIKSNIHEDRIPKLNTDDKFYNQSNKYFSVKNLPIYGVPEINTIIDINSTKFLNSTSLIYNLFSQKLFKIIKEYKSLQIKKINEFKNRIIN